MGHVHENSKRAAKAGAVVGALVVVAGLVACGPKDSHATAARQGTPPVVAAEAEAEADADADAARPAAAREGAERVGQAAPSWPAMEWLNSPALALSDLRGQVVLIRFWTDTCPFCRASAPALATLDAEYRERGVAVIGMYHPKPRGSVRTRAEISEVIDAWGWRFPVAVDTSWKVLDDFWLAAGDRNYTSVSFILDREGVIRHVHPGPEFHPDGPASHEQCRRDYAEIQAVLDRLLAEPV